MKYDVLLFDLDDTLFDFGETEKHALFNSFQTFSLPNGLTDYRASYHAISSPLWNDLEQGRITLAELKVERFKQLFLQYALDIDAELFSHTYLDNLGKEIHLIDGVEAMLTKTSPHRLAVLTNGFTDVQYARINGSSLRDTFETIITSEEAGCQKPQPGIFDYTFEKLRITDKSRVLMIGDSLSSDIQGGHNYGIDTCWFNPNNKKNTTAILPTYEIQSWDEFFACIHS
ncbi:YjjG family noncanonical pyrimidine nucleotidase [Filibacter tadaridae]|uniref:HAD-hydrolase YfnB n=1 Tax=Filibacter tadaridae TaxID=2483811 RepID=A0A3P5XH27_9BACL|nr:YjjG family noncanonical pyrimidine nucleotidase [Filibacter tadaridae]VDC29473.1 Putative HAD-hydrolase YfnB [Filibacter tadaridae]